MYIQFLVEDISGSKLIDIIMKKYHAEAVGVEINYDIRPYKGIGGIPKGTDAHSSKSQQLLNDTKNPKEFQEQLKALSHKADIKIDHVFCIAVEEMEVLADLLTKKGFGAFQKQNPTPYDVGKCKIEWAESIGNHLDLRQNKSMSFLEFISQLDFRRNAVLERG